MDLRLTAGPPSASEREAVDSALVKYLGPGESDNGQAAVGGIALASSLRPLLLPALHSLQDRAGHITHTGLDYICQRLLVPPAEAYGVASAYALFQLDLGDKGAPSADTVLHVCDDIACRSATGTDPCEAVARRLGPEGEVTEGLAWERSSCLGHCELGSAALLLDFGPEPGRRSIAPFDPGNLGSQPDSTITDDQPAVLESSAGGPLLRRVGLVDPWRLQSYLNSGGYEALRTALALGPRTIIEEIKRAKLTGRGGAGFPTGAKWEAVASNAVFPHYFVCNADESEPGTFKDRVLMEQDPFALIEAVTIAGYAVGAQQGYLYLRGEYPLAEQRLRAAIVQAKEHGFLGRGISGSQFDFDIELRRGAGAYIAGEETALFNSIEGRRPEPRNKPPFPTQMGLFGRPTAVNNVETVLNVLDIVQHGGDIYSLIGTPASTGTRLFCLSGCVRRPGVYEAPHGLTLRNILDLAGGIRDGSELRCILLGGAAGSFILPDRLDLVLSSEGLAGTGLSLGSGVVLAFDQHADMTAVAKRIARFFRDESCGQCVPCRVGTVRQEESLARICAGRAAETELVLLRDLERVMKDASICGLGQTASNAVMSAIRLGLVAC